MSGRLAAQLDVDFEQLRRLAEEFRELIASVRRNEPTTYDLAALATMLHSFYGGVENAMKRIADAIDGHSPAGAGGHAQLLEQMAVSYGKRGAVFDDVLAHRLREYLRFRHVFRHAYSFDLRWEKMEPLVEEFETTCRMFEEQVRGFLARRSMG